MRQQTVFSILGLASLGLLMAPSSATAFTLVNSTGFTDTDFENLRQTGQFTELFVAEGRIGDRGGSATYEVSINDGNGTPVQQRQNNWISGQPVDFTVEYTGNTVIYTLGDRTLTTTAFTGPVSDIFIRTFAQRTSQSNGMQLTNLLFYENGSSTGQAIGSGTLESFGTATSRDTDYLQLSNISGNFRLTGTTVFSWTGTAPTFSNLAYQIKAGTTSTIPEPGTVGALLLTTVVGVGYRQRKKATRV